MKKKNACSFLLVYKVLAHFQIFFVRCLTQFRFWIGLKKEIVAWYNDLIARCNVVSYTYVYHIVMMLSFCIFIQLDTFHVAVLGWIDVKSFSIMRIQMFQNMFYSVSIDERSQQLCCVLCVCAQDSWCLVRIPIEIIDGALMPVKTTLIPIHEVASFSNYNRQFEVNGVENHVLYFIYLKFNEHCLRYSKGDV